MKSEMELNSFVSFTLIGMYGKCGDLSSDRRVFDMMKKEDIVTSNVMITGEQFFLCA